MSRSVTPRGFAVYDEVDCDGDTVTVQQSSCAIEPCVWLRVEGVPVHEPVERRRRGLPAHPDPVTLMAHLTIDDARRVKKALAAFIREHK